MSRSSTTSSERYDDGLVSDPTMGGRTRLRLVVASGIVVFFLAVTAGTGIVDRLAPTRLPILRAESLVKDEAIRRNARFSDGTWARLVEHDERLRSRVRAWVLPTYAYALLELFGETRGNAVAGRDGWFFLSARVRPQPRTKEEHVALGTALVTAVRRRLRGWGHDVVVIPIPRKSVVHQEKLRDDEGLAPGLYGRLLASLHARQIRAPDILTPFRAASREALFFKIDTHWNDSGQVLAADVLTRALGIQVPLERRDSRIRPGSERTDPGDILRSMGIALDGGAPPLGMTWPRTPTSSVVPHGGRSRARAVIGEARPLGLVGTSFTRNRRFADYVAHFAGQDVGTFAWQALYSSGSMARFAELDATVTEGIRTLIWELPTLEIFCRPVPFENIGGFFAARPPARHSVLARPGGPAFTQGSTLRVTPDALPLTPVRAAFLAEGFLQHTGDGVVGVRLAGDVKGTVRVDVATPTYAASATWTEDKKQIFLPLIASTNAGGGFVTVSSQDPDARLRLEAFEVVSPLDSASLVRGRVTAPVSDGNGWRCEAAFGGATAPDLGGAVIQLALPRDPEGGISVDVLESGSGTVLMTRTFERPKRTTLLVLDGSPLDGRKIGTIRLRGSGPVPRRAVALVALARH